MDKSVTQFNIDLDIRIFIGNIEVNIFCINYEAPIPGWSYKNHSHSSYELHFIPQGKGTLVVENKKYQINSDTFYLTGPGIFHSQKADLSEPMNEYCINFEINIKRKQLSKNKPYLQSEIDTVLNALLQTNFWFGKDEFKTIEIFEKIMSELENQRIGYFSYIQSLLSQVIFNALRSYTSNEKSSYSIPKKILNDSRRYMIDKYFQSFDKVLTRSDLAFSIGTSVRQLNRIMQEYYEMSFKEKLTISRLEQARYLLINSKLLIGDIALQTGHSSQSQFNKVFKKYYDYTPLEYRRAGEKNLPQNSE